MQNNLDRLESLARLSKEASSEGRQELLREVTEMFMVEPDALSEKEVKYFGDIMGKLAFEVEMKFRQHLSETMANVAAAPLDLVKKLANDEIEVARPILTLSGVLQEADLLEIIKQCGQDHLQAMSRRESVSETLSDAIVEKGNDDVLGTLAANPGAELSENAMETMVVRSEGGNGSLQEALVTRDGLPPELLKKMAHHVSDALRQHIVDQGIDLKMNEVDQLLAEAEDWMGAEAGGESSSPAEKFILRKEKLNQLNPQLLVKLMLEGKQAEFIAGVSRLAKIDLATARQAIADESGEKLAVVCRALDFDSNMFSQLVDLLDSKGKRDIGDKKILVGVYGRITAESAQRAMRFLRTRQKLQKNTGSEKSWG
ncbi:MAG: DUF2336 domain-containing protein [Rhodospirillales bacterium]|nr:DUF2336 domain-containing protein [Rhodospirillales bacterium]